MARLPLPIAAPDCCGCGACCEAVGTPPGFAAFFAPDLYPPGSAAWRSEDYAHFLSAPESARSELADYYAALDRAELPDRSAEGMPCLWYDAAGRTCRNYGSRPQVCRDFRPGSAACLHHRGQAGLATAATGA